MKRPVVLLITLVTPLLASAHPGHPGHDFEWGFVPLVATSLLLAGMIAIGVVLHRRRQH